MHDHRDRRHRQEQEAEEQDGAAEIDQAQPAPLLDEAARLSREERADDVGDADDGRARTARPRTAVPGRSVNAGRCTMMKATWKPQTKKPAVSSQKLGCREGLGERLLQRLLPHRPAWCARGLPPIGQASGMSSAVMAISQSRLACQPTHFDQQMHHRQRDEAADAGRHADRGDGAQPLLGRGQPADGADQRGDAGAADADAHQDAADQQIRAARSPHT